MKVRTVLFLLIAALALGVGCEGSKPAARVLGGAQTNRCVDGSFRRLGSRRLAFAAIVRSRAKAYRRPGDSAFAGFGRLNQNGVPTVLAVLGARVDRGCAASWYRVQLPLRPNGITGWVRASAVSLATVKTRIEVDLTARRLTLFRNGRRVLSAPVAIGAPATPTPAGHFYVNQRLIPAVSGGPYGPGALGISAFSDVLTSWPQGGPVAIHGTNEPWSIGRAVSNGCIRLRNATLSRVFALALAGTPVLIHP